MRVSPDQVCVADLDSFKKIHRPGSRHLKSQFYRHLVPANTYTVFSFIDPQDHANRRRLLAAPMSDSSLAHMEPIIAAKVRLAIARAGEEMQERGVADVFKWWLFMATDVIGELTFGKSFEMLELKKVEQAELAATTGSMADIYRKTSTSSTWNMSPRGQTSEPRSRP